MNPRLPAAPRCLAPATDQCDQATQRCEIAATGLTGAAPNEGASWALRGPQQWHDPCDARVRVSLVIGAPPLSAARLARGTMKVNIAKAVLEEHRYFVAARPLVNIDGLSSPRVCNFLNRLVSRLDADECYLEIGTYKGLTLISAALDNLGKKCVGCDKFRLISSTTGIGVMAKRALMSNLARYGGRLGDIAFHHTTSRRLFARGLIDMPVGVYFYDGDHSRAGTYHGMVAAAPYLSERAVVAVDDWNDPTIRRAAARGLRDAQLRILWQRELHGDHSLGTWWNGLGVFFVEKSPEDKEIEAPFAP